MSLIKPPNIDTRTPEDVEEQTRQLMCKFLGWDPKADGGEAGKALMRIFAHLCSLVIDRINRAPEKNFLAFLDLLGNTLIPAAPARVPLSFTLTSSAVEGALLPSGTRLFSPPPAGASDPIYFETEDDLWLTTFELKCLLTSAGSTTTYTPLTTLINNGSSKGESLFPSNDQKYYFGFAIAEHKKLPAGLAVVIYFDIEGLLYDPDNDAGANTSKQLVWEYTAKVANGEIDWKPLYVEDQTQLLTATGKVVFEVPSDFSLETIIIGAAAPAKDPKYYWIRVTGTTININPSHLKWVAINTVTALQAATVHDEILGSSTGSPGQTFKTFSRPVLPGQRLAIREKIATPGNQQTDQEGWQLWKEVPDFYASKSADWHYMLDHNSGIVTFGNGKNGMIPPLGVRNIRMESYRYGGGQHGNVPSGVITNFWAPLNRVDKVTNFSPAIGGSDAETYESLLERAPKVLRHRNRAVTETDYEDLARLASTDVAVARCVPLIDLAATPYNEEDQKAGVGKVSIIIVPKTTDEKPTPSLALIRQVKEYIILCAPSIVSVSVVGPLYLQVDVTIKVRIQSIQGKPIVKKTLQIKLAGFLHPLTGRDGAGWPFGRVPHASDFYRLLNTVKGIDYIEAVDIRFVNSQGVEKTMKTGRFLICSGVHTIDTTH